MTPPGARILRLAEWLLDRRTIARLIAPAVADLQHEYQEAARLPGPWPRRRALARGYAALGRLAGPATWSCSRRFSTGFATEDERVIGRLIIFMLAAVAVLTATLVLPPILEIGQRWPVSMLAMQVLLCVPQALALALPLGLLAGTLIALRGRGGARSRIAVVRLGCVALAVCLLTLITTAWLVPAANQRFREVVADALAVRDGRPVPVYLAPGPNEMTFTELSRRIDLCSSPSASCAPAWGASPSHAPEMDSLRFSYHMRLALACSPIALLLMGMGVSAIARGRWWAVAATVVANPLSLMVIWGSVPFETMPRLQAWLPMVAMAAAGSLMLVKASRRQREALRY